MRWPETEERLSHGMPTWWGGKKTFANFADGHHGDPRTAAWIKQPKEMQADIIASRSDIIWSPPYKGPAGWVAIDLDEKVSDWALIEDLLERGYRMVAPKRAIAQLDG